MMYASPDKACASAGPRNYEQAQTQTHTQSSALNVIVNITSSAA